MSNVKRVHIVGRVRYGWLDEKEEERVAMLLGRLVTNPFQGLKITAKDGRGKTAMIHLEIEGEEAISYLALDMIVETIKRKGTLKKYDVSEPFGR